MVVPDVARPDVTPMLGLVAKIVNAKSREARESKDAQSAIAEEMLPECDNAASFEVVGDNLHTLAVADADGDGNERGCHGVGIDHKDGVVALAFQQRGRGHERGCFDGAKNGIDACEHARLEQVVFVVHADLDARLA